MVRGILALSLESRQRILTSLGRVGGFALKALWGRACPERDLGVTGRGARLASRARSVRVIAESGKGG